MLIARLTAQLRCYVPEPVDETWGRLRHLGARREQLIAETVARSSRSATCSSASGRPRWTPRSSRSGPRTWVAAMTRDPATATAATWTAPAASARPGSSRRCAARSPSGAGRNPACGSSASLFAALADPAGVIAHRRGALERVAAGCWRTGHDAQRQAGRHRGPDDRGARRARADRAGHLDHRAVRRSVPPRSWPRPATRAGSPPPGPWSSTPAWRRGRSCPAPSPAAPSSPAKADPDYGSRPGGRSGERCRPTPSTPPATDT